MKNFEFKIHENTYSVKIVSHEKNVIGIEVNGTRYEVKMKEEVARKKTPTLVRAASKRPAEPLKVNPSSSKTKILAPIPGVVMSVHVKVGDSIKVGDKMMVLEAMKMENNIVSEKEGVITAINVTVGQQVLQDDVMIELE